MVLRTSGGQDSPYTKSRQDRYSYSGTGDCGLHGGPTTCERPPGSLPSPPSHPGVSAGGAGGRFSCPNTVKRVGQSARRWEDGAGRLQRSCSFVIPCVVCVFVVCVIFPYGGAMCGRTALFVLRLGGDLNLPLSSIARRSVAFAPLSSFARAYIRSNNLFVLGEQILHSISRFWLMGCRSTPRSIPRPLPADTVFLVLYCFVLHTTLPCFAVPHVRIRDRGTTVSCGDQLPRGRHVESLRLRALHGRPRRAGGGVPVRRTRARRKIRRRHEGVRRIVLLCEPASCRRTNGRARSASKTNAVRLKCLWFFSSVVPFLPLFYVLQRFLFCFVGVACSKHVFR